MNISKSIINNIKNAFASNIVAIHNDGYIEALRYKDTDKYYLQLYSDKIDAEFKICDDVFDTINEAKTYALKYAIKIDNVDLQISTILDEKAILNNFLEELSYYLIPTGKIEYNKDGSSNKRFTFKTIYNHRRSFNILKNVAKDFIDEIKQLESMNKKK